MPVAYRARVGVSRGIVPIRAFSIVNSVSTKRLVPHSRCNDASRPRWCTRRILQRHRSEKKWWPREGCIWARGKLWMLFKAKYECWRWFHCSGRVQGCSTAPLGPYLKILSKAKITYE